jgi:hypothetical protein
MPGLRRPEVRRPLRGLYDTHWVLSRGTLIDQLVMGAAVLTLLTLERIQRGRTLGIVLAAGLVGTSLVGMALADEPGSEPRCRATGAFLSAGTDVGWYHPQYDTHTSRNITPI